jgi:hypothetical protein
MMHIEAEGLYEVVEQAALDIAGPTRATGSVTIARNALTSDSAPDYGPGKCFAGVKLTGRHW